MISARTATLGAVANAGQELFRLIRQNRLDWRGQLTAEQLSKIKPKQHIALTLPDGTDATAIVRETAPALDPQSRLGIVYADIIPGSSARQGMYAEGPVKLGERSAVVVPSASVVVLDGRSHVLELAGDGSTLRVSLVQVATGRRIGDNVEIVRGVAFTDRMVVEGAGFLSDGDVVRVTDQAARPAKSGGQQP